MIIATYLTKTYPGKRESGKETPFLIQNPMIADAKAAPTSLPPTFMRRGVARPSSPPRSRCREREGRIFPSFAWLSPCPRERTKGRCDEAEFRMGRANLGAISGKARSRKRSRGLIDIFGTFFLDSNGLNIVEPAEPPRDGVQAGRVIELAHWTDARPPKLVPHDPEPTDLVIELEGAA